MNIDEGSHMVMTPSHYPITHTGLRYTGCDILDCDDSIPLSFTLVAARWAETGRGAATVLFRFKTGAATAGFANAAETTGFGLETTTAAGLAAEVGAEAALTAAWAAGAG